MPNLKSLIERQIPAETLATIHAVGALVEKGKAKEAYLVGGPVRDLMLGRTPGDLDFTVVGDAQAFAGELAVELQGMVDALSEFGTARIRVDTGRIDIATARSETYREPGALPEVQPAGIREDLARRDFTVNAMALPTWPARWGELVDYHNGFMDVSRRRIRVLHDRSFADDPTRIMRALRYEARLGFTIESHTLELMERDLQYLDRLSPARIRAELNKILAEPMRAEILGAAEERGVLAEIDPGLRVGRQALEALRQVDAARGELFLLALATATLTSHESADLIRRLDPPKDWREVIEATPQYRSIASILEREDLAASEIVELLSPFPDETLEAQRELAPPTRQKERLNDYLHRLRYVGPECTGDDLIEAGVPEGPAIGILLADLREARLDGKVRSKQDELALVKRKLPGAMEAAKAKTRVNSQN
ncbi:MAG: hypothetical protein WD208_10480 [Dehalococcoidia bacterium]